MVKTFGQMPSDQPFAEYTHVVDNTAGRSALTGMTIGDTIFQIDEGSVYIADSATTTKVIVSEGTVLPSAETNKGLQFFRTDEDVLYRSNGTSWIALN